MPHDINKNTQTGLGSNDISRVFLAFLNEIWSTDSNGGVRLASITETDDFLIDAFGRSRTSSPFTLFDSKQLVDNQPLLWDDQQISGAGTSSTYNTGRASTSIAVSANTAGHRVRQTYQWFNYQPSKSQMAFFTFVAGEKVNGITRRVGLFYQDNGIFFEIKNQLLSVGIRSKVSGTIVDTAIDQSRWNKDKLDGSGRSRASIDVTKSQIGFVDFEWLGVGIVRWGFVLDGKLVYCHAESHANELAAVYMSTPNLPIRYEIINDGTGTAANLEHICTAVLSEGGVQESGLPFAIDRGSTPLTTANDANIYPLLAWRLKSTHPFATIIPESMSLLCTSTAAFRWLLMLNPTVTGTAFSFSGVTNSSIEADVSRTNATTLSGGTLIKSGYAQSVTESAVVAQLPSKLRVGTSIAGVSDILVLAVQRLSGTSESFYASLSLRDIV